MCINIISNRTLYFGTGWYQVLPASGWASVRRLHGVRQARCPFPGLPIEHVLVVTQMCWLRTYLQHETEDRSFIPFGTMED